MAVIGRMTETPSRLSARANINMDVRKLAFRAKNLISLSMRLDQRDGEVSKGGCPLCTRRSLSFQIDLLGADDYHIHKIQQPFCVHTLIHIYIAVAVKSAPSLSLCANLNEAVMIFSNKNQELDDYSCCGGVTQCVSHGPCCCSHGGGPHLTEKRRI